MRNKRIHIVLIIGVILFSLLVVGCRSERISDDPTLRLEFSEDTVRFDTVFTSIGSSTRRVTIYNRNANALRLSRVMQEQSRSAFDINIDGETNTELMTDWVIRGGDSLYMYIRVTIDPNSETTAFLTEDNIHFVVGDGTQTIHLEAYAENMHLIRSEKRFTQYSKCVFHADLPYLIYDTVVVTGLTEIEPGARLYFHRGASLNLYGNLKASGTAEQPIFMMGDRRDHLFDSVPYSYAAGQWDGVYLIAQGNMPLANTYKLSHTHILSGNIGLYTYSENINRRPTLTMDHCRIHNHSLYGLVLSNADADIRHTEISNAASYCVYLAGGKHHFDYVTVASYFNHTTVNIQSTGRENVPAIYVDNLDKDNADTELHLSNSIVVALRDKPLVTATPLQQFYHGEIENSYVHRDTAHIFRNTIYEYNKYDYYDFRLDSLSPARYLAKDSTDAGCYPFEAY